MASRTAHTLALSLQVLVSTHWTRLAHFVHPVLAGVADRDVALSGRCSCFADGGESGRTIEARGLSGAVRSVLPLAAGHTQPGGGHLMTSSAFFALATARGCCVRWRTGDALGTAGGRITGTGRTRDTAGGGAVCAKVLPGRADCVTQVAGHRADTGCCLVVRTFRALGFCGLDSRVGALRASSTCGVVGVFVVVSSIARVCKERRC